MDSVTVPLIRPNYTLKVVAEHIGHWREIFWFNYTKKGDVLLHPSLKSGRVGQRTPGRSPSPELSEDFDNIEWSAPGARDHFTLHPSAAKDPRKVGPAVHGPGGVKPTGLDLRTLTSFRPLVVHRLTYAEAYPLANRSAPTLYLGRPYRAGAPEIILFAGPLSPEGNPIGDHMKLGQANGIDFAIAPTKLTDRRFLIQLRVNNDPERRWWPFHQTSFPRFIDHPVPRDG